MESQNVEVTQVIPPFRDHNHMQRVAACCYINFEDEFAARELMQKIMKDGDCMCAQRFSDSWYCDAQELSECAVGNDSVEHKIVSNLDDRGRVPLEVRDDTYYHKIGSWIAEPQVQELEQAGSSYAVAAPSIEKKPKFESLAVLFEL